MFILFFAAWAACSQWSQPYLHKSYLLVLFSSPENAPFSSRKYLLLRVSSLENIENLTADCYMNEVPSLYLDSLVGTEYLLELRFPSLGNGIVNCKITALS